MKSYLSLSNKPSSHSILGPPKENLGKVEFLKTRKDKAAYKLAIRTKEKQSAGDFSDSFNDVLMYKNMDSFWKTWKSTFCGKQTAQVIDGYCDEKDIADRFASVFQTAET